MPSISEKVEALTEWMKKYPKAIIVPKVSEKVLRQYSKTDEEYKKILEEYEKMRKYYNYVIARKRKDKLDDNEIDKCKSGNVGGVFRYQTQIEELAKKYGISQEKINYIIGNYGTIDNFYKLFKNQEITNVDDVILANSFIKDVVDVDCKFNVGYDNLYKKITRRKNDTYNEFGLYSSERINTLLEKLSEKERTVLERRFCLTSNNKSRTLAGIGREMEITPERVRQIERRALKRLRFRKKEFTYDINKLKNSDLATDDERIKISELEKELNDINFSCADIKNETVLEGLRILKALKNRIEEKEKRGAMPEGYITIENAKFSTRAYNVLNKQGINYLQEIPNYTYEELEKFRNNGRKTMEEIVAKLEEHGLQLKEKLDLENLENEQGQIAIENANFSTRAYNVLNKQGINYLQEIPNYTYEELKKFRNIGRKTMEEIVAKLEEHGLQLKEKSDLENVEIKPQQETEESKKQELVAKILEQQKTISEQQNEISELSRQKKEL